MRRLRHVEAVEFRKALLLESSRITVEQDKMGGIPCARTSHQTSQIGHSIPSITSNPVQNGNDLSLLRQLKHLSLSREGRSRRQPANGISDGGSLRGVDKEG
jgi:hypothetical protein